MGSHKTELAKLCWEGQVWVLAACNVLWQVEVFVVWIVVLVASFALALFTTSPHDVLTSVWISVIDIWICVSIERITNCCELARNTETIVTISRLLSGGICGLILNLFCPRGFSCNVIISSSELFARNASIYNVPSGILVPLSGITFCNSLIIQFFVERNAHLLAGVWLVLEV